MEQGHTKNKKALSRFSLFLLATRSPSRFIWYSSSNLRSKINKWRPKANTGQSNTTQSKHYDFGRALPTPSSILRWPLSASQCCLWWLLSTDLVHGWLSLLDEWVPGSVCWTANTDIPLPNKRWLPGVLTNEPSATDWVSLSPSPPHFLP